MSLSHFLSSHSQLHCNLPLSLDTFVTVLVNAAVIPKLTMAVKPPPLSNTLHLHIPRPPPKKTKTILDARNQNKTEHKIVLDRK